MTKPITTKRTQTEWAEILADVFSKKRDEKKIAAIKSILCRFEAAILTEIGNRRPIWWWNR